MTWAKEPKSLLQAAVGAACLLAVVVLLLSATPAVAQDAADPPADNAAAGDDNPAPADGAENANEQGAAEGEEAGEEEAGGALDDATSLGAQIFLESSYFTLAFYVVLIIFSIVGVTVVIERLVNLRRAVIMPPEWLARLKNALQSEGAVLPKFRELTAAGASPVERVFHAGVLRAGRTLPEVEKAMEDAAAREMAELRGRTKPLQVVGNVAPLVGLLGTVVGMIFAFSIASEGGMGKGAELANGIQLALYTTAGGLAIAIPAMLASAWFNARVERYMREIDEQLLETIPAFAKLEEHGPQQAAGENGSQTEREDLVGAT